MKGDYPAMLRSVPVTYRGVTFRSTLEADWAATLDSLDITWQYEPEAVELPSGERYRCDFYLPDIATWLEVKGPHDERIHKAHELAEAVKHKPDCDRPACCGSARSCKWEGDCACGRGHCSDAGCDYSGYAPYCGWEGQLVVIGRAPIRGYAEWELIDTLGGNKDEHYFFACSSCGKWYWHSSAGSFGCRAHRRYAGGDDDLGDDGPVTFVRSADRGSR